MLSSIKEYFWGQPPEDYFDHREKVTLSDGGTIHVDFKGFNPQENEAPQRSVVIMILGLTGNIRDPLYIQYIDRMY